MYTSLPLVYKLSNTYTKYIISLVFSDYYNIMDLSVDRVNGRQQNLTEDINCCCNPEDYQVYTEWSNININRNITT